MLTPEQVTQFRTSAGLSATPPSPTVKGSNDIINQRKSALGLDQPAPKVPKPDLGDYSADAIEGGVNKITSSISRGAYNLRADTAQGGILGSVKAIGHEAETGLGVASGFLQTLFSPVTAVINDTASHLSDNPLVQKIAMSGFGDAIQKGENGFNDWAQKHPELATNLSDALNVGLASMTGNEPLKIPDTATLKSDLGGLKTKATDILGGAKDKVSSIKNNLVGTSSPLSDLADATSGVANKKSRISALEQTGAVDKKSNSIAGTKQTLLRGIKSEPTGVDLARAKDVQGIVNPKASPVDNLTSLNKEISRISEEEISPALEKAGKTTPISDKAPGWNTTVQRLNDIPKPDIIRADATLDKTYDLVRNRMIEQIKKQPATVKGLWDARKSFDSIVKEQYGDVAFDSEKNTAIKRAITDMRRTVNDIIGERVPEFKSQMSKLSNLYDARYNIAEQFQDLVNKGGWKAFKTLNPKKAALLKWGAGTAAYEGVKHTVAPFLPGI